MFDVWLISALSLGYLGLLFAVAWFGDKSQALKRFSPYIYSLSLGVYCTSWAFYGTTAQAANNGWWLAPTYAGSILVFAFAWELYCRVGKICAEEKITSLADFIATRYGQSARLSGMVSLISVIAIIPYIALQLRAISSSFQQISGNQPSITTSIVSDQMLYITLTLAAFAILFGTRRVRPTEHNPGLIGAIAFESIIKLLALFAVGIFVVFGLFDGFSDILSQADTHPRVQHALQQSSPGYVYLLHMFLGFLAMFCLPRQFHVGFIERNQDSDMATARWLFPLYLLLITLFTLPTAYAGLIWFSDNSIAPDTFVLALPMAVGDPMITLIAYLGGFSAATSMVIISALVLSIMITNDFINQFLLRRSPQPGRDFSIRPSRILTYRRLAIFAVLLASYGFYRLMGFSGTLANIGLISFALVAQFAPALFIGLLWKSATAKAAQWSLTVGTLMWAYTLLLPTIHYGTGQPWQWVELGVLGIGELKPTALFGAEMDMIAHGVLTSLTANVVTFLLVSKYAKASLSEQIMASRFVGVTQEPPLSEQPKRYMTLEQGQNLLSRFLGTEASGQWLQRHFPELHSQPSGVLPSEFEDLLEKELAALVGGASSKLIVDTARQHQPKELDQIVDIVDEASQVLKFNRDLLQSTMENIDQGISVVDHDLRLVAWNSRYLEMFAYPDGEVYVGRPVKEVIQLNAQRGFFVNESTDVAVSKRLHFLRSGSKYRFRREHRDGRVFEMQGNPLPGGGFVTTYTDVTEYIKTQQTLERVNENLEQKVQERTADLSASNQALTQAKQIAEQATESKTRFFAAASHDLLQPFNAASLFCSIMNERAQDHDMRELASNIRQSLGSAESLLSTILELTKLEAGAIRTEISAISLADLVAPLDIEFTACAEDNNLTLAVASLPGSVNTDVSLLRRVLQNLLSNAIRYTEQGNVSLSMRVSAKDKDLVEIQVSDTGAGIPKHAQARIFEEFQQLEKSNNQGLGLGLAITRRICDMLDIRLSLVSEPGQGSCFTLTLPYSRQTTSTPEASAVSDPGSFSLRGKHIWVIDNDSQVLKAMDELLRHWGANVHLAKDRQAVAELIQRAPQADLYIVDYQLDHGDTGVKLVQECLDDTVPVIINTADHDEIIREIIQDAGYPILYKPLKVPAFKRTLRKLL